MQHPQYKIIDRDSLFRSNLASDKQSATQIPTRLNLATLKQPPTGHHNSHTTQLSVLSFRKGPSRATQEFLSRELCRMSHFYFWELSRYHYTLNDPWGICRREQRPNRRVHAASPPQPSPANECWHGWKKSTRVRRSRSVAVKWSDSSGHFACSDIFFRHFVYIFSWWSDREEIKVTDGIKADIWREYDPGRREHVRCWKNHPTTGKVIIFLKNSRPEWKFSPRWKESRGQNRERGRDRGSQLQEHAGARCPGRKKHNRLLVDVSENYKSSNSL